MSICPACNATVTAGARGGLLPHHPGVNAGTPHGGAALCFPGLPERACERTFAHVAHDWHASTGSFRCEGRAETFADFDPDADYERRSENRG